MQTSRLAVLTIDPPRRVASTRCLLAVALSGTLVVSACGDDVVSENGSARPTVVATTGIWADVVRNLTCDGLASVETVIPTGGDAHAFEPSLADRDRMEDAALVVMNGLALEEGLSDTLDAVAEAGTPVFAIAEHVDRIQQYGEDGPDGEPDHAGETDHEEEHDHEHEGADPHVWLDPVRVSTALSSLAEELVTNTALDAAAVDACLTAYQQDLAALDTEVEEIVAAVPEHDRLLITNHESLGYFADRYRFEVIGTVIPVPSGLAETSPVQLQQLAELIDTHGVRAIFAETQQSTADADALADQVGDVEVVTLYTGSLGEPGSGADTYAGLLRTDARLIADALS